MQIEWKPFQFSVIFLICFDIFRKNQTHPSQQQAQVEVAVTASQNKSPKTPQNICQLILGLR